MTELAAFIENEEKQLTIQSFRTLTEQETTLLKISIENISELKRLYYSDYSLKKNYFEFLEYADFVESNKEMLTNGASMQNLLCEIMYETNRLLLNLLFSISSTIEHFKHNLKKIDRLEYEKMISVLFDTCQEYSFVYKLRNFAQHQCLPISNIQTNDSMMERKKISIYLNKEDLLKYDSWGKIVKPFLEKQESTFEIMNIVIEAVTHLNNEIFIFWINKYIDDAGKDFEVVLNFMEEIIDKCKEQTKNPVYPICLEEISSNDTSKKSFHMTFSHFPIAFLEEIGVLNLKK